MNPKLMRMTGRVMVAVTCLFTLPMQTAQAGMVGTEQLLPGQADRSRAEAFFARDDVRQTLEQHGVSAADAQARVAAMTDTEINQLNQRLDQMPAGGDALGLIFTVFVILLITDILGFTKVFPFTRSIR